MILASSSKVRARILKAAGLAFIVEPPGLDEGVMRQAVSGERALGAHDVAEVLARAKAEAVSDLAPKAYVIGADQVLAFGNQIMSKPDSMETARRELLDLSGKSHTLHTAVAVATNGETIWATTEMATLTMRKLSPEFIGRYLAAASGADHSHLGPEPWIIDLLIDTAVNRPHSPQSPVSRWRASVRSHAAPGQEGDAGWRR